jgi:protein SOK2
LGEDFNIAKLHSHRVRSHLQAIESSAASLCSLRECCLTFARDLTGHSRPFLNNTEKLELPSISQVHTRGPADIPWLNHHPSSQRSLFSSDRLPNLQLPQTYPTSVSSGTNSSRIGSLDSSSNYSGNHYTPSLTSASSFPSVNNGTGLKTPSPSQASSSQPHVHTDDTTHQAQYPSQSHDSHVYSQESESYSSAMNPSQQYVDSQHSHMSGGPSYAPQSQTSGGMSHYPQYPQQAPALQPVHGAYAPSPSYGQYSYATGVTSPQAAGQPVSTNTQLLPLPGKFLLVRSV